jgi:hypothetical protein
MLGAMHPPRQLSLLSSALLVALASDRRAQRVAANCANQAADLAFAATTAATPLGIACSSFIATYDTTLRLGIAGSRVRPRCRPEAEAAAAP